MEEEENPSGHIRRERRDEFLVSFSVNNGMIILIIILCVLKLKSRGLAPLFAFVLGRPGTGRILFPYTFPEI